MREREREREREKERKREREMERERESQSERGRQTHRKTHLPASITQKTRTAQTAGVAEAAYATCPVFQR